MKILYLMQNKTVKYKTFNQESYCQTRDSFISTFKKSLRNGHAITKYSHLDLQRQKRKNIVGLTNTTTTEGLLHFIGLPALDGKLGELGKVR